MYRPFGRLLGGVARQQPEAVKTRPSVSPVANDFTAMRFRK